MGVVKLKSINRWKKPLYGFKAFRHTKSLVCRFSTKTYIIPLFVVIILTTIVAKRKIAILDERPYSAQRVLTPITRWGVHNLNLYS